MCLVCQVFNPTADMPKFSGMVMVVRLADALDVYTSSVRNNVRSRSLTGPEHPGLSLRVQGSAVYKTAEDRAKLTHVVQRPPRLQVPATPDVHFFLFNAPQSWSRVGAHKAAG